jgi:acyl carrier protein
MSIHTQIEEIFREVFDDADIEIEAETTARDIDGWDSLSHVNLIVSIETRMGIRFTPKEVLTFRNVGELIQSVQNKLG